MNSTEPIRVMIVDDSLVVRRGIRAVIESEPAGAGLAIVAEAGTAATATELAERTRPDVVLLDLRLPDQNGLQVCRQLRHDLPRTCVLILTSSTDQRSIYEAILAGAHGYLLKEIDPGRLIEAIRDGHAGRPVFSNHVSSGVLKVADAEPTSPADLSRVAALSPQERKVLAAIAAGHSNKEIADLLGLSPNTVKNYIANMFQKLGVERRAQAMALYLNRRPGPSA